MTNISGSLHENLSRVLMYTLHYVHIYCLRLNQPLMHLLYITLYLTFAYVFWRTSVPSSVSLIFNFSIFGATTCCEHLSHFSNTFGQVFTARCCAENWTVKYENSLKMAPTCAETRRRNLCCFFVATVLVLYVADCDIRSSIQRELIFAFSLNGYANAPLRYVLRTWLSWYNVQIFDLICVFF